MKRMFARVAAFLAIFALSATAAEITSEDARALFKRWAGSGVRLGSNFSADISEVSGHLAGTNRFFSVKLKDGKSVILSGDSSAKNPIIAFSTSGDMPLDEGSPLVALLEKDLEARLKMAASVKTATDTTIPISEHSIDDMRVKPFVMTKWGQSTTINGAHCFDYYTPKANLNGEETRTVCGCVATAMSQLMRYWQWPSADNPVVQKSVKCQVPGDSTTDPKKNPTESKDLTMLGGTYNWEKMDYVPKTNDETCRAIGKLTSDCGIAVGMMYNFAEFGGSGAYMNNVCPALRGNFHYEKAVMCSAKDLSNRSDFTLRAKAILSNLDAKMPVLLGIRGGMGGHAVVADGYGFSGDVETPYIHLNMGWNGQNDVWYNVPDINVSENPEKFKGFNVLDEVCYNIFPTNDLEIVAGRIFDLDGNPLANVNVRAYSTGVESGAEGAGVVAESKSSEFGVYALAVPAGASYIVHAETVDGSAVGDLETEAVGSSSNARIGNLWGVNLEIGEPSLRVGDAVFASFKAAMREVVRLASEGVERPLVEIIAPLTIGETVSIGNDCIIASANDDPGESAITLLNGATISVGGTDSSGKPVCPEVCFSNIVFRSPSADFPPTLTVSAGSSLRFAAATEIDTVFFQEEKSGYESRFILDGFEPSPVIVEWSGKSERGAAFASAENMDGDALADAARLLSNALDDGVGGAVDALNPDGSYSLVWEEAPCPAECAFAKTVPVSGGGATTNFYRSLDALLKDVSEDAEIILTRNCALTGVVTVANSFDMVSAEDAVWPGPFKVVMEKGAAFAILEGGRIKAENVAFRRKQESQPGTNTRFVIDGGEFVLGGGASISGFKDIVKGNLTNGVVYVSKGAFKMESGSSITECGSNYRGGAVYLAETPDAVFDFSGGEILNCYAAESYGGGAVYACANARVAVSGDALAEGNTAGSQNKIKESDIELANANESMLRVGSMLSGKVGVRYGTPSGSNKAGGVCAELADSSYGEDPGTLRAIFSPIGTNTLEAVVCETNASLLAWRAVDTSAIPTVADGVDADAILIVNGAAKRYEYLEYAFAAVGSNQTGRIVLLRDCMMTNILSKTLYTDVSGAVTLDGDGHCVYRTDSRTIKVPHGASLAVTNVVFDGSFDLTYTNMPSDTVSSLFWAKGGDLAFEGDTLVFGVVGSNSRAAGAVVVEDKGTFTMEAGAEISSCINYYVNVSEGTGVGAGVLADTATVRLRGGAITGCMAYKCGGVCLANKSTAEISGDVTISGNVNLEGEERNLVYHAIDCGVVLAGGMDGHVGVKDGYMADTNVFGRVDVAYLLSADEEEIIVSASNFVHDVRGARGLVATNGTDAILVWSDACDAAAKTYTDGNGVEYRVIGEVPPPPEPPEPPAPEHETVPCLPFTFTSIVETPDGKWRLTLAPGVGYCTYSLYASDVPLPAASAGTDAAWGAPVAVTNLVSDGEFMFEVESSTAKKFWAVKGEDGEK